MPNTIKWLWMILKMILGWFLKTGRVPGFLKLFYEKCVCMCVCACIICFLSALMWANLLLEAWKQPVYKYVVKSKQSLYCTYTQVSSALKVGFFPQSCTQSSNRPHTSRPASLVNFSGILQLKNSVLGLIGIQGMGISSFGKWVWPVLMQTKMKSSPEASLEEFSKNNTIKRLKAVKKIFLRIMEQLLKYASLATLNNVLQEIQVIHKLWNTLLVQLQNYSKLWI